MPRSELGEVLAFTTVAVGRPGQRVFHLQARTARATVTLRCEKAQVAALAEYLRRMLADLPEPDDVPRADALAAQEPLLDEFAVGAIGVAYDLDADRLLVQFEEFDPDAEADDDDDPDDPDDIDDDTDDDTDDEGGSPAVVRLLLTRGLAHAFVRHATDVVLAGRPTCRFCGRPMDPDGHPCPRMN